MNYRIEIGPKALKQIQKLPRDVRLRIRNAIDELASDPRPIGSRKVLTLEDSWRIKVGDYRVVYEVRDEELLVTVIRAAHRKDVYDRL